MKNKRLIVGFSVSLLVFAIFAVLYRPNVKLPGSSFVRVFAQYTNSAGLCSNGNDSVVMPLKDFTNYPCLGRDPGTSADVIPAGCVRTVCREQSPAFSGLDKDCVPMKDVANKICTYDPKLDLVSNFIHQNGHWEGRLVDNLVKTLKSNPQLVFLDLGCNIGVYTIAAASIQTRSYCVDANYENLRLVSKSLSLGHLHDHVTLIWNALSDQRTEVSFNVILGNAGASRVDANSVKKHNMTVSKRINVNALMLDELEWLFRGKELYVKMDIEAHDLYVLKGAYEFFKNIDVKILQMELLEKETFSSVVDLLYSWGYLMFRDPNGIQRVDRKDFVPGKWPGDVYFIKLTHLHRL